MILKTQALAAIAALLIAGCASVETTSYKVIGVTTVSVDAAMNGWGDYVRAGKATFDNESAVRSAYGQYQAAMRTAQAALQAYQAGKDKATLDRALDVLDAMKNALINQIVKAKLS